MRTVESMKICTLMDCFYPKHIKFKYKQKITIKTGIGGAKYVEIMVSLKHLSSFLGIFEMPLIKCEANL